jgi:hypothetical protein
MKDLVMKQLLELANEPVLFLQGGADSSFLLYGQSFETKSTTTMPSESVPAAKSLDDESDYPMQTSPMNSLDSPETDLVTELFNYLIRRNVRQGREASIGCVDNFALMLHAYFVAPQPSPINLLEYDLPKQVTPAQDNEAGPTPPQSLFAKIEELKSQGGVLWSDNDDEYTDFDDSETDWSIATENFGIRHRLGASSIECSTQYSLALAAQGAMTTPICP